MSQPPAKRRRTQFSVAEKKEIVAYKTDHPTATQDEIATRFTRDWGKQVGRSTVSDILCDKEKWSSVPKDGDSSLRQRSGKHEKLEQALYRWFTDVRSSMTTCCLTKHVHGHFLVLNCYVNVVKWNVLHEIKY